MILDEVKTVMPSFVARVERPDRGGRWVEYLEQRSAKARATAARLGIEDEPADAPSVRLSRVEGDEELLLAALLFEATGASEETTLAAVRDLGDDERGALLADLLGDRENRRHRPGRGLEALRYRFEIVSDYGAFRDLQRHRMLTVQWQALTPHLGAAVPEELVAAGAGDDYAAALERSAGAWQALVDA